MWMLHSGYAHLLARVPAVLWVFLAGCLPMVPVPTPRGDEPYPEITLSALQPGVTTREEVFQRMGVAPIVRQQGKLQVFGAARETGGRLLIIAWPFIPISLTAEEFHLLYLEFDSDGVLRNREIVVSENATNPICDSHGHCLRNLEWTTEGVVPVWMNSGGVKGGERATVTASFLEEESLRRLQAPQAGCLLYFFGRSRQPRWYEELAAMMPGEVYFAIDDRPRFKDSGAELFAVWRLDEGPHRLVASTKKGEWRAESVLDCARPALLLVLGEVEPTVSGLNPKVRFTPLTNKQAEAEMASRRLLLE